MIEILFLSALCLALGLQFAVTIVIIALRAKGSKERVLGALFLGGPSLYLISLLYTVFPAYGFRIVAANILPGTYLTCVYFLLFTDIADRGSTSSTVTPPLTYLLYQSLRLVQDIRGVDARKHDLNRSKSKFIRSQAAQCALSFAIPELIWSVSRYIYHGESWEQAITSGTEFLFFEATSSQLLGRVVSTIGFWLILSCILDTFHRFVSILSVASGFSRPEDWPGLYGSVKEAYSIGRFWGLVSQLTPLHYCEQKKKRVND